MTNDEVNECGHTDAQHERMEEIENDMTKLITEIMSIKYQAPMIVTGWNLTARSVSHEENMTYIGRFQQDGQDVIVTLGLAKYDHSRAEASIYHEHD